MAQLVVRIARLERESGSGKAHFDKYQGTVAAKNGTKGAVRMAESSSEGRQMPMHDDPEVYRAALDSVTAGVYLVDRTGKILFWNSGAERITGHLRQDVVGHSALQDFLGHLDGENNQVAVEALPISTVLREGKASFAQVSIRHKSGHRVLARLHAAPIRDTHGALMGAVESFEETIFNAPVDDRQSKLHAYGCIDEASGVLNHDMVQAHLRETLVTFAEHPVPFSALCIGIDCLDAIKSRYGAGAVAAVIRVVGQTLENSLRPTDFIGRWQEDEFLALLMECGGDEVVRVGERLRKVASQSKVEWWGDQLPVTISMGATDAIKGDTVETIPQRAENGLRESIRQGGNRVVFWNERA
jgi:diguanylate cyclase (GGDEF)-like protein/PAS domain S-box-containing protein